MSDRRVSRTRRINFIEIVTRPFAVRSSRVAIARSICLVLKIGRYHRRRRESCAGPMLIKELFETRKADASLATDIRAALIESLFAPIASLILGALACSIIGAAVALRVGDSLIMANSIAIFAVGML